MRTHVRESTVVTRETWVPIDEVIAYVQKVHGDLEATSPWFKGWESACAEIIEHLKEWK